MLSSALTSSLPLPPPSPTSPPPSNPNLLRPIHRQRLLLLIPLSAPLLSPLPADARGLFRMPPARLSNRYFLVRAGESEYERIGVVSTNPVAKTSMDNGLSGEGARQAARSGLELQRLGACDSSCWIWPSITQRSYQAAEIIASLNGVDRSHIVPEYSFLDARGLGAYEGRSLDSVAEVYDSDGISPNIKPPPIDDGTPNESVADVYVRVTQLMSILETQYSGDTVVIVSPDSDNLTILQAGLIGLDLRRHKDLFFRPGEVRLVDPKSIPDYKQPASAIYKCTNPPSCTFERINREIPTGPNPIGYGSPPIDGFKGIRREVPGGPNPLHHGSPPPMDDLVGINREVPTGPNPMGNGPPPIDGFKGIKREVPGGSYPMHHGSPPPIDGFKRIKREAPGGPDPLHH